ncbi:pancreatic secretory granule membrane major glycoprotein GP2-like [Discoglossus pictus]
MKSIVLAVLINCAVAFVCDPPCYSDEQCVEINNMTTCVCNTTLYHDKRLNSSVNCDGGKMVISVNRCLLDTLGYDFSSFTMTNKSEGCNITYPGVIDNKRVQSLQAKVETGWCGNRVTVNDSQVYYANTLHIGIKKNSVVTVSSMDLNFICAYNLTMQTSLIFALRPLSGTTYLKPVNGEALYPLTMAAYKDTSYTVPLEESDTVLVGAYVYLGLFIEDADGSIFALRVDQCFATPTNDPENANKVQFVKEGCAVDGDVETKIEENGVSLVAKVRISSFKFQGYNNIFIYCDVRLCNKTEVCSGCQAGRALDSGSGQVVLSLNLDDQISYSSSGSHTVGLWTVLVISLLRFVFNKLY